VTEQVSVGAVVAVAERRQLGSLLSHRLNSILLTRSSLHGRIYGFVAVSSLDLQPAGNEYQEPYVTEPGKRFGVHW